MRQSGLKAEAGEDNSSRIRRGSNMCKIMSLVSERKLAVGLLLLATFMIAAQAQDQQAPLTDMEKQLADLVNQNRTEHGLPVIPVTNSLTEVARAHIADLNAYHPDTKNYGNGNCNTHSWSNHGAWTAVCYTGSGGISESQKMWNKPREITDYNGDGYEIAYWNSLKATPSGAMESWKTEVPPYHLDVILERNMWQGHPWKAMGVGIDGNYAVVWFGDEVDPAGPVPTTAPSAPTCTKSYCTDVNVLHKCDHGSETIKDQGCWLGLFGPPNEQFRVGSGTNASADVYYAEFNVDIVGGTGQADPVRDAPKLIILIDKHVSGGVDLTKDSQFKINNGPARKLKDYDSKTTDEGKDKLLYKLAVSDLQLGKNTLLINPKDDAFAIYKIWIENAKGERIWQKKNDPCSYQSECVFLDIYNPYQLACDFTTTPHVCKEKKGSGKPCKKNFECVSGTCSGNSCA
jgi:hypothetical protein